MYDLQEFRQVVAALRAPDGCPWDKVQTHESMITCLIEETYEVIEAIRILEETKDSENLCEELGDLLLQVVMQSQMAEEEGYFTLDHVVDQICDKMYRRHPHVFGQEKANNSSEALGMWEAAKGKEKGKDQIKNQVEAVPVSFPGLYRYQKMLKKACRYYDLHLDEIATLEKLEIAMQEAKNYTGKSSDENLVKKHQILSRILASAVELSYEWDINAEELLKETCTEYAKSYE